MTPILWAFGSVLIVMFILYFLPIGLSVRGKVFVVLVSFVLALGGIAAVLIVPLWEIALMLFALIFFTSYFMEKQYGSLIFKAVVDNVNDEFVAPVPTSTAEKVTNKDSLELQTLEVVEPLFMNAPETNPPLELTTMELDNQNKNTILNSEISSFLERDTGEMAEHTNESDREIDYLSDIESLLALETEKRPEEVEEIRDSSPKNDQQKQTDQVDDEADSLDDSLFDFLLATREVVTEEEDFLEEIKPKEKIILQK